MAPISFIGSYSGIDQNTIEQLLEVERLPLKQLSNKKDNITEKQNAWRDINTRLNSLFEKIKALQNQDTFLSKIATSSNEDYVTMSPSKNAASGIYRISVGQLATNTNIIGGKVLQVGQTTTDQLGLKGSFTMANEEGKEVMVEVNETDSLRDIVNKINKSLYFENEDSKGEDIGIKASIIDGRIVLTDEKSGNRNISLIDGGEGLLSDLALDENNRKVTEGQQAQFTINGVQVESDTNSVTDVLDGVTINLNKTHEEGQYDTVTIGIDEEKAVKALKEFVDQYNSTMNFIEDKLKAGDPNSPGSRGPLAGDSSLMRLQSSLRQMVTSSLGGLDTKITDISQLGVKTQDRFGQLTFDENKFKQALRENREDVMNFFFSKTEDNKEVGFVSRVNNYIDGFISKSDGIIKSKTESYDRTIRDINRQIDRFNERIERREAYYYRVFAELDTAMMQAESQMSWLYSQLDAMGGMK